MKFEEKTIRSEEIFKGKIFTVKKDTVKLPDNSEASREVVTHHGGAGIIAVDDDRNILLVRQYRKGVEREVLEIPAGKLEKNEDPKKCCERELLEETGYAAGTITDLGKIYPTPAYCSEIIHIYMATDLIKKEQKLDSGEFLEVIKVKLDKAYDMVLSNKIRDAKTVVAVLKAKQMLDR